MPYHIEALSLQELDYLEWASARGYDAGLLDIVGVSDYTLGDIEHPDYKPGGKHQNRGIILLNDITESQAWEIKENIEQDQHAWLACCGLPRLIEKLQRFVDSIV